MNHDTFYQYIREYVALHPEAAAHVNAFVAAGITKSLRDSNQRATDFETALAVAIAARYKGREELILSKLKEWNGKSALDWTSTIATLEKHNA